MSYAYKINVPPVVLKELEDLSHVYQVKRLILFGSRARGDHLPKK